MTSHPKKKGPNHLVPITAKVVRGFAKLLALDEVRDLALQDEEGRAAYRYVQKAHEWYSSPEYREWRDAANERIAQQKRKHDPLAMTGRKRGRKPGQKVGPYTKETS